MKRNKDGYSSVLPKKTAFVWDRFTSGPIVEPKESISDVQIREACKNDIIIWIIQQIRIKLWDLISHFGKLAT